MPSENNHRRGFLSFLAKTVLTVLGAAVGAPALAYFVSPLWRKQPGEGAEPAFSDAGPVAELLIGEWRLVTIEAIRKDGWETNRASHSVWVRRGPEAAEKLTVLSSTCPHLGCSVIWLPKDGDGRFVCPCHKGTFDAEGRLISGPPPRGLDALDAEVREGRLWVRWQDFKIGTPNRIAVEA